MILPVSPGPCDNMAHPTNCPQLLQPAVLNIGLIGFVASQGSNITLPGMYPIHCCTSSNPVSTQTACPLDKRQCVCAHNGGRPYSPCNAYCIPWETLWPTCQGVGVANCWRALLSTAATCCAGASIGEGPCLGALSRTVAGPPCLSAQTLTNCAMNNRQYNVTLWACVVLGAGSSIQSLALLPLVSHKRQVVTLPLSLHLLVLSVAVGSYGSLGAQTVIVMLSPAT